jgi:hypothetical protein
MAWLDLVVRACHEIAWPIAAAWIAWYFRDAIKAVTRRKSHSSSEFFHL